MAWFDDLLSSAKSFVAPQMRVDYTDDFGATVYRDPTLGEYLFDMGNKIGSPAALVAGWLDMVDPPASDRQVQSSAHSSGSIDNGTPYNLGEYLSGLLSSVGAENQTNRLYNSAEAAANREFQSVQAEKNRQWQEAMSNSAYTRAVADMQKAGLNPALLFSSGSSASTPAGATAQGSAASYNVGGGDTVSSIINSLANSVEAVGDILQYFIPSLKSVTSTVKSVGRK